MTITPEIQPLSQEETIASLGHYGYGWSDSDVAEALTRAGYVTTTARVGGPIQGIQICQHHCPVSHVAEEFPELCETERQAISEVLGTHVQRLASIANGDCACTTHVPLTLTPISDPSARDQQGASA